MVEGLKRLAYALSLRFKSRAWIEAENLVLRQQVNVLVHQLPKRLRLTNSDRLLLGWLYRLFPSILERNPNRQARDCDPLASARLSRSLALEVTPWRGSASRPRDS